MFFRWILARKLAFAAWVCGMEARVAAVAERWKWNDADTRARMHKEVRYGPSHLRLRLRATLQPLANMTVAKFDGFFFGLKLFSCARHGPCTHQTINKRCSHSSHPLITSWRPVNSDPRLCITSLRVIAC
jgi:hypothetical protein